MNREKAFAWADALDSGEYAQATGVLTRRSVWPISDQLIEEHCCLGVQCKLALKDGVPLVVEYPNRSTRDIVRYDDESNFLPPQVRAWGEFKNPDPYFKFEAGETRNEDFWNSDGEFAPDRENKMFSLSVLNDAGFTFNQIADIIRRFYDQL